MREQILGTITGMALGDAMGMPSELWSRRKIKEFFGTIDDFLDSPPENPAAIGLKRGEITDDTCQALIILDSLIETGFVPDKNDIAAKLLAWATTTGAFEKNILGQSSKAALLAVRRGEDPTPYTERALTNGAAMRIAPIGCLFPKDHLEEMVDFVYRVSEVTHKTDVAVAGAAMIAAAVSAGIDGADWEDIMEHALRASEIAMQRGCETYSASLAARLRLGMRLARDFADDEERFYQAVYDLIGCGTLTSEAVPAALAVAYYARTPRKCSLACANLGGDTDTIGAMATAICGAKCGVKAIDKEQLRVLRESNRVDFERYADVLLNARLNTDNSR